MAEGTPCVIEECKKGGRRRRAMCDMHYRRWQRYGDPLYLHHVRASGTLEERWWTHVTKTETCWLWTAFVDHNGYGMFATGEQRHMVAHRWGYLRYVGEIHEGQEVDHLCRVRRCVRFDHLEAVSHRTNVLRGESMCAQQIKRTHCPKGHPYDEENTRMKGTMRHCRTCDREWSRNRRRKADPAVGSMLTLV